MDSPQLYKVGDETALGRLPPSQSDFEPLVNYWPRERGTDGEHALTRSRAHRRNAFRQF